MKFLVPIRVRNGQNCREFWAVKAKRAKHERMATIDAVPGGAVFHLGKKPSWRLASPSAIRLPVTVSLTRIYTRQRMDIDGNVSSLKHVQDAVAELLGIDDGDEDKVTWKYSQQKGDAYGVLVQIEEVASV